MPREAKVFIVEDNEKFLRWYKEYLVEWGHTVVLEARTLKKALENVKKAKANGVNVAVLDGSLDILAMTKDGAAIAEALRKEIPDIKIVSCSGSLQDWGDVNLLKLEFNKIGKVVSKL